MKFPFYDAPNTATITCCHILENGEPILYVSHDEDDGMWQFLCGKAHETDEAKLVSLKSVFDLGRGVWTWIIVNDPFYIETTKRYCCSQEFGMEFDSTGNTL